LRGKKFEWESEIETEVNSFLASITKEEWCNVFDKGQERMQLVIHAR
jgi:hypothetical protein